MEIILDRIDFDENGMIIATFEVGEKTVAFTAEQMPGGFADSLIANAIVECEIVNGSIVSPVILHKKTKQREEEMRSKLNRLIKRKQQ